MQHVEHAIHDSKIIVIKVLTVSHRSAHTAPPVINLKVRRISPNPANPAASRYDLGTCNPQKNNKIKNLYVLHTV
jgi:hypothetical protein